MLRALVPGLALLLAVSGCGVPDEDPPQPGPQPEAAEPASEPAWMPLPLPPEADLSPFERAVAERMEAIREITVEVDEWEGGEIVAHGSGVLVSPDGDVLTAGHVVKEKKRTFRVVLPGGQSRVAEVAATDEAHDAALLHTSGEPTPFVRLPARVRPAGEWVVCAGHAGTVAGDRLPTRSAGVIVERSYAWDTWDLEKDRIRPMLVKGRTYWGMLQLDCTTAPGMSGGPVVTLDGELVGMVIGTPGVASSIEAIRHLVPPLPRASTATETPRPSPSAAPTPVSGPDGRPSRAATFEPLFASSKGAGRSVVQLDLQRPSWQSRPFPAVLVSSTGLAVVPAVRIASLTRSEATVPPEDISVVGHPDARCTEIVAVRDELALVRLSGLLPAEGDEPADGLVPVGPAGAAAVGELVGTLDGADHRSTGFLTAVERHPGTVAPHAPNRGGCGHRRMVFQRAFPAVTVVSALAHDAEMPQYGSLIVDRLGRPLAIEVASGAYGVDLAVPWPDVLSRFDEWLRP